jgi:hypothetical protein
MTHIDECQSSESRAAEAPDAVATGALHASGSHLYALGGREDRRLYPTQEARAKFVHYTTAEAALSIIRSKRLWMRNATCMADYSEVTHGYRYLTGAFGGVEMTLSARLRRVRQAPGSRQSICLTSTGQISRPAHT